MANITAHIAGTVWKLECKVGDTVAILESMKMEMPVETEEAGTVTEIVAAEGDTINEGDILVIIDPA